MVVLHENIHLLVLKMFEDEHEHKHHLHENVAYEELLEHNYGKKRMEIAA